MKRLLLVLFVLFTVLLALPRTPGLASPRPAGQPAAAALQPVIATASERTLNKLSPDLRTLLAHDPEGAPPVLVSVRVQPDTAAPAARLLDRPAISRQFGAVQWVVGAATADTLPKLASLPGVAAIATAQTYQAAIGPEVLGLRRGAPIGTGRLGAAAAAQALAQGGKAALLTHYRSLAPADPHGPAARPELAAGGVDPTTATIVAQDIHGARAAQARGYDGRGVTVALVDSGVDFAHPDLQGSHAVIPSGPYAGWPYAYNVLAGIEYARDASATIGPDTFWNVSGRTTYTHTLPVPAPACNGTICTASLKIDYGDEAGWWWPVVELPFTWPDVSRSGAYYYTVHPDFFLLLAGYWLGLGYAATDVAPAAVIVADTERAGVYDTVYVDVNFNADLRDDTPLTRANPVTGADIVRADGTPGTDGRYDLSAGMLTWISDGANPPPGVGTLYAAASTPEAGRLLAFLGDDDGHGTNCASDIVARGVISDPAGFGATNPLVAGAADRGGVGGPVLAGMAPGAKIMAFQNGYFLPDAWLLAALGVDGAANSGDEAQIVSNSFGDSSALADGWTEDSRLIGYLNHTVAPNTTWLVATGNGGHGYGTVTSPGGGTAIDVGASTAFGSLNVFEPVGADQITYGAITPFSNRGPGALGDLAPDVVAVGAFGSGANPLNFYLNGEAAYDIFGGTSMATPIAAGVLAQIYQAYRANPANGENWPTYQAATDLLLGGSHDLGYDPFTQGAGNVDADRATATAAGAANSFLTTPSQWYPGDYRGVAYPAFPRVLTAGAGATGTFTVTNPSANPLTVTIRDTTHTEVAAVTHRITLPGGYAAGGREPEALIPITQLIANYDPDLVRAQLVFPFDAFAPPDSFGYGSSYDLLFYNWTDHDGDGRLWVDANRNGIVDRDEIDAATGPNGAAEYHRFAYSAAIGNYLEVSLGRDALSRVADGAFLGVQRGNWTMTTTLDLRLSFYRKTDWDWLSGAPARLDVPARGSATFTARLDVPAGAQPGAYQGALEVAVGAQQQIVPVVSHVAATGATFTFGSATLDAPPGRSPYLNGNLFGGSDWGWRYDAGDWRLFFYDLPAGTARSGRYMLVDTTWSNAQTDVDTWVFGAAPHADAALRDPAFFGPTDVELIGGSADSYVGGGAFRWQTATGGPQEIVGAELRDGLGLILLHNVLSGGERFDEAFSGRAYQVELTPGSLAYTTTAPADTLPLRFSTAAAIGEGVAVRAFGFSQPEVYTNLLVREDFGGPEDASQIFARRIVNGGLLDVMLTGQPDDDVDLYVWRDGGDEVLDGADDVTVGASLSFSANERVTITFPEDGLYWILVYGFTVVGANSTVELTITIVQGEQLAVARAPEGPLEAGEHAIDLRYRVTYPHRADTYQGLLVFGPANAPAAIIEPVTLNYAPNLPAPAPGSTLIYLPQVGAPHR